MKQHLPCAIYTRKSSEEGLEQDFNSLDAQREACEAYIVSQKALGWKLTGCFEDGGYSGGNMARPGLQKLLAEIAAKRIRVIVVYKVDRLTRSLADFAKLVEQFDAHEVSFVSVTQAFNTTTSMGRLTLNVLLSFAQFEREVTGERIRDKIAASKRKGMWMGGNAPIGYLPKDRTLVINEPQAERVRQIYRTYLQLGRVSAVKREIDRLGWVTPKRQTQREDGKGERPFTRGHLYRILSNPIYVGRVPHKTESFAGNHPAIVDQASWDAVQSQLAANVKGNRHRVGAAQPSLLAGLIYGSAKQRLTPSHATKGPRRYRYYVEQSDDAQGEPTLRVPAQELETLVLNNVIAALRDEHRLLEAEAPDAGTVKRRLAGARSMAAMIEAANTAQRVALIGELLDRVDVGEEAIRIRIKLAALDQGASDSVLAVVVPMRLKRCGMAMRLIVREANAPATRQVDSKLVALLAKARRWFEHLSSGRCTCIKEVAALEKVAGSHATRVMYLAFLAPDIVQCIAKGEQSLGLDSTKLMKAVPLPADWTEQRVVLGMGG